MVTSNHKPSPSKIILINFWQHCIVFYLWRAPLALQTHQQQVSLSVMVSKLTVDSMLMMSRSCSHSRHTLDTSLKCHQITRNEEWIIVFCRHTIVTGLWAAAGGDWLHVHITAPWWQLIIAVVCGSSVTQKMFTQEPDDWMTLMMTWGWSLVSRRR